MHFEREVPAITCNHIYTYIFYLQSVYLQDVLTVSSGPARLVTIMSPVLVPASPAPSGAGVGHQLYVLNMTVSNKCLLIFFQRLCAAEFVVRLGVGILPRAGRPPGAREAGLRVPACTAVRPCGTCSLRGAPVSAWCKALNYDSRRPARPAPEPRPAAGSLRRGLRAPWRRPRSLARRPACLRRPLRPETGPTGRRRGARPRARTGRRGAPSSGWGPRTPPRVRRGAVGRSLAGGALAREGGGRPRWGGPGRAVTPSVHRRARGARARGQACG